MERMKMPSPHPDMVTMYHRDGAGLVRDAPLQHRGTNRTCARRSRPDDHVSGQGPFHTGVDQCRKRQRPRRDVSVEQETMIHSGLRRAAKMTHLYFPKMTQAGF